MTPQATLEGRAIDVSEFEDIADQVTGAAYSVERPTGATRLGRPSTWFRRAEYQLRAIERLGMGWDSQGGDPPDRQTVRSGASLLQLLSVADRDIAKPHIHPTRSGGVQFHWEAGPRYFEIEVLDPRTAQYYYVDKDFHEETEGELRVGDSVAEILRLLHKV